MPIIFIWNSFVVLSLFNNKMQEIKLKSKYNKGKDILKLFFILFYELYKFLLFNNFPCFSE